MSISHSQPPSLQPHGPLSPGHRHKGRCWPGPDLALLMPTMLLLPPRSAQPPPSHCTSSGKKLSLNHSINVNKETNSWEEAERSKRCRDAAKRELQRDGQPRIQPGLD